METLPPPDRLELDLDLPEDPDREGSFGWSSVAFLGGAEVEIFREVHDHLELTAWESFELPRLALVPSPVAS